MTPHCSSCFLVPLSCPSLVPLSSSIRLSVPTLHSDDVLLGTNLFLDSALPVFSTTARLAPPSSSNNMRPMPVKFQDAEEAPSMKQHQAQHQELSSTGGGGGTAFSPTRRVGARGGPQLFAQKLFTLVEEENSEIVEWLPDGLAFRVKDIQRFSCEVLEKYFNRECVAACVCVCFFLARVCLFRDIDRANRWCVVARMCAYST